MHLIHLIISTITYGEERKRKNFNTLEFISSWTFILSLCILWFFYLVDHSNYFVDVEFAAPNSDSCYWNWAVVVVVDGDLVALAYGWTDLVDQAVPVALVDPVNSAMDTLVNDAAALDRIEL